MNVVQEKILDYKGFEKSRKSTAVRRLSEEEKKHLSEKVKERIQAFIEKENLVEKENVLFAN